MVVKPRVGVIGAGPGGIAMGIQLAQGGFDFTIFERGDGFGGTWRNNTYPGAACDVPSHFYSFSFALNPYWSKTYANQPEILAYLERVADRPSPRAASAGQHRRHRCGWSDADSRWTLETQHGERTRSTSSSVPSGMLDVPNVPAIPDRERFGGRVFHSSRWDHSKSTAGERVASIGTGASAMQYVPAIAAETEHLTVFQRTPIWVAPRFDDPFTPDQQELFASDPAEALKLRDAAFDAVRGGRLRCRIRHDQDADRHVVRLSDEEGAGPATAREVVARLPRWLQASTAVQDLVSGVRAAERHVGDRADRRVH